MDLAGQYAQALHEKIAEKPASAPSYLKNLRASMRARGHEGLLPRVFAEYEKLELRRRRRESQAKTSPEAKRTRELVELYRTLIAAK